VAIAGIDRPGLGRSDPHPAKTLTTWIDDVRHLLRRVDGSGARAVGFSQGGPFALALAGAELVEAVALVAAQDELGRMRHLLHPDVAAMLAAAEADAADFERRIAATATADWLWNLVVGMSGERDRAFYTDSALGPAYQRALEEGFAQGSAGYARDLAIVLGRWPVPVEEIAVPVDLWYGGQDTSTVHSPDLGRTLAARLPRGRLHLLPDEGGSLLWTRAPEILAALARS
jgi:pimeloyl-ACP methyl ester carboxylesterase